MLPKLSSSVLDPLSSGPLDSLFSGVFFMRKLIRILCLALACCGVAVADEGHHHEELTQEQLGTVHFPVSCASDGQKSFEKGVALLHSFWYEQSGKTFQEIEKQD